jgi:hypothetical protein
MNFSSASEKSRSFGKSHQTGGIIGSPIKFAFIESVYQTGKSLISFLNYSCC